MLYFIQARIQPLNQNQIIYLIHFQLLYYRDGQSIAEILRPPENSVPQIVVLRYQEMGGILCTKQRSNGIVTEYLDRNITFFYAFQTIYP
jgi:hypothetical protein